MVKVREDMTGWVMSEHGVPDSRLTVIEQTEDYVNPNTHKHTAQWKCICSCENHTTVISNRYALISGHTKSCGCFMNDKRLNNKFAIKYNNIYKMTKNYGILLLSDDYPNEIWFDLIDKDIIMQYQWRVDSYGYPTTYVNGVATRMHQLIGCKSHDHINRNKLDNRRCNLRPATQLENMRNKSKQCNNTSGVIGVGLYKKNNRWVPHIRVNGKQKNLGYFDDIEDAIKVRLQAELKYFGEFAPQQHLFEKYGIEINNKENDNGTN